MKPTLVRAFAACFLVAPCAIAEQPAPVPVSVTAAGTSSPAPKPPRKFAELALSNPRSVAVDVSGNLYVGDVDTGTIHRITPGGEVQVLPGGNSARTPIGLAVSRTGAVIVADSDDGAVFRIAPDGAAESIGKPAAGEPGFAGPTSVAVDSTGNIFVTDNGGNAIRRIAPDGALSTFAGKNGVSGYQDGNAGEARFVGPRGIAIDGAANLYVADEGDNRIRKITPAGVVSTLAGGNAGTADGRGGAAAFGAPRGLAADDHGNIYVADTDNHTIRKITPDGVVSTLAGKPGEPGHVDGKGAVARFSEPRGVAVDRSGDLFIADTGNAAIRRISPDGTVATIVAANAPAGK